MEALLQLSYDTMVNIMLCSMERNLLPDVVVSRLTRLLLASRLRSGYKPSSHLQLSDLLHFVHYGDVAQSRKLRKTTDNGYISANGVLTSKLALLFQNLAWVEDEPHCVYLAALKDMPIAIETDKPKVQHYELPTSFLKLVLGKNLTFRIH